MPKKLNHLLPIGLLMLACGLLLNNWAHGHVMNFSAGFLIGLSLVFMVTGFVKQTRAKN